MFSRFSQPLLLCGVFRYASNTLLVLKTVKRHDATADFLLAVRAPDPFRSEVVSFDEMPAMVDGGLPMGIDSTHALQEGTSFCTRCSGRYVAMALFRTEVAKGGKLHVVGTSCATNSAPCDRVVCFGDEVQLIVGSSCSVVQESPHLKFAVPRVDSVAVIQ